MHDESEPGAVLGVTDVVDGALFDAPFRWRMGVRTLAEHAWLQIDGNRAADLSEKDHILRAHRDDALVALPSAAAACEEVTDLVAEELAAAGHELATTGTAPLEVAARSVQEDLCVMAREADGWRLTAGAVCFPTRWSVADKLGATLAEIHGPVPDYADVLETRVDRFFDRLQPGALVWRLNWSIVDRADRRLPADDPQAPVGLPENVRTGLHLRIERQTVRRLTQHTAAVFGIRIHSWPLGEVLPHVSVPALCASLTTMPPEIAVYKDLAGVRGPLAAWLQRTS